MKRARDNPSDLDNFSGHALSGLGAAVTPYMRSDNVLAVVVHKGGSDGWYADLLFKDVPPGVSEVIGTPYANPHRTKGSAEDEAYGLVMVVLATERQAWTGNVKTAPAVFRFGRAELRLVPAVLVAMEADSKTASGFGSRAAAYAALDELTRALFRDGITQKRFEALTEHEIYQLMITIHGAVMSGVLSYPPDAQEEPTDDRWPVELHAREFYG